jgi:hypothetical protein
MFFIVGSARSGTTLMRLMLNAHPEVVVPPESRFIVELWTGKEEVSTESYLSALGQHRLFKAWNLPVEAVGRELGEKSTIPYADAISATYRAYAGQVDKSRWGDKTPRYVEHISLLDRLFPESHFVHLVRDGRNVAMSYADVPFGPKTVAKAASLWAQRVSKGIESGRRLGQGRYIELRYEDLVEDPSGEMKTLCSFLGIEFDPGMLEYTDRARDSMLARASRYNPHLTEAPISEVRAWQDTMPERHVEIFEAVAGSVLSELGYERRYPHAGIGARAAANLGRMGLPIDRLKRSR